MANFLKTGLYFNSKTIAISRYEIIPHNIKRISKREIEKEKEGDICAYTNSWKICKYKFSKSIKSCLV